MEQSTQLKYLSDKIDGKGFKPTINLDRPIFIQPEDRISYRSCRVLLILGMLNTKNGLSKEVVACMDFLLRNPAYRKKFIVEYYKDQSNFIKKLDSYNPGDNYETDFNIVQYKSVPWDLRFNDMFLFLYIRKYILFKGTKPTLRVIISEEGVKKNELLKTIFVDEVNFLEIFGSKLSEDKAISIITDVIPNSYWKENEKFNY